MKKYYLLNIDDYFARYYELEKYHTTKREAWNTLECELWEEYRITKYSSYASFRKAKHFYQNKIK